MLDRGSLCFAELPAADSWDRGGNEAGGEAEGGGVADLRFVLRQFRSLAPRGMVTPPGHATTHLCTQTTLPEQL